MQFCIVLCVRRTTRVFCTIHMANVCHAYTNPMYTSICLRRTVCSCCIIHLVRTNGFRVKAACVVSLACRAICLSFFFFLIQPANGKWMMVSILRILLTTVVRVRGGRFNMYINKCICAHVFSTYICMCMLLCTYICH